MKLQELEFNSIWIVGMPFSGKTSAVKKLSSLLKWEWKDSDQEISKKEELSIDEIFAQKGEIYFRKLENTWIHEYSNLENTIVSTGGGLPVFYNNMDRLKDNGLVIFLHTRPQILAERSLLSQDRPLVKDVVEDLETRIEFFQKLLFERMPFYSMAHITVYSERELLDLFKA